MRKRTKTKALSGAAQDAYFRRVLKAHPALSAGERDRLLRRLRQDVAQLRVRIDPTDSDAPTTALAHSPAAARRRAPEGAAPGPGAPSAPSPYRSFDPFFPNVIVVLRKSGRAAALAALDIIDNPENLRLLAREQRLSVGANLTSAEELRAAIVAAAERRIANRLAAAS